MNTLALNLGGAVRSKREIGFLRRQFQPPTTRAQLVFDVVFGILAPIACFVFDPIVFKAFGFGGFGGFGDGFLAEYRAFTYLVSGLEIGVLTIFLFCGKQLQPRTRLIGGALLAGAFFSGAIGLLILPLSLLGLMLIIGVFGFTPFLTALVFLRNGRSALRGSGENPGASWIGVTVLGGLLAFGMPAALNFTASMFISNAMNAVIFADNKRADIAVEEISYLRFVATPDYGQLLNAYTHETEPSRKEELSRRYKKITGEDIDQRLRILSD